MNEVISLDKSNYQVKLHEGIKAVILLYLNEPELFMIKRDESVEILLSKLKDNENYEYYILAANFLVEVSKRYSEYKFDRLRREIVSIYISSYISHSGILEMRNYLYDMKDKGLNKKYDINIKTLNFLDEQIYLKIINCCLNIIFSIENSLTPTFKKYISITKNTSKLLYSELSENEGIKKLYEDIKAWIQYNNLDYFIESWINEDKIYLGIKIM